MFEIVMGIDDFLIQLVKYCNYWPNSFGGPAPDPVFLEPPFEVSGLAARTLYKYPNDDFVQPGNLYRDVMTDQDRENLVGNIASHLSEAVLKFKSILQLDNKYVLC